MESSRRIAAFQLAYFTCLKAKIFASLCALRATVFKKYLLFVVIVACNCNCMLVANAAMRLYSLLFVSTSAAALEIIIKQMWDKDKDT